MKSEGDRICEAAIRFTKARDQWHKVVSETLRHHRCRDWHIKDDGGSMQLIDVLSQHSEDGTVSRAIEEIDDLAADIVDAIFDAAGKSYAAREHIIAESDCGAAVCGKCGKDLGWYCPESEGNVCEYSDDECCIHCGEPEERQ